MQIKPIEVIGGSRGAPPLRCKIFLISSGFCEILEKIVCRCPLLRVGAPSYENPGSPLEVALYSFTLALGVAYHHVAMEGDAIIKQWAKNKSFRNKKGTLSFIQQRGRCTHLPNIRNAMKIQDVPQFFPSKYN